MVDIFNTKKNEALETKLKISEERRIAEMSGRHDGLKIIEEKNSIIDSLEHVLEANRNEIKDLNIKLTKTIREKKLQFDAFWVSTTPLDLDYDSSMSDEAIAKIKISRLKLDIFERLVKFGKDNMVSLKTTKP